MRKYIFILPMLVLSSDLFACKCSLGTVAEKLTNSKMTFVGTVKSVKQTGTRNRFGEKNTQVLFDVEESFKGQNKEVILYSNENGISCDGYNFKESQRYIVYAYETKGGLNTRYCGGVIPQKREVEFQGELDALNNIMIKHGKQLKVNAVSDAL